MMLKFVEDESIRNCYDILREAKYLENDQEIGYINITSDKSVTVSFYDYALNCDELLEICGYMNTLKYNT